MSVSHSAGPNAAVCKTGRFDKVHRFSAEILAPFILSVIKKQITSCRRHEAISRAEARKAWRRFDGASRPGAGASANPCVPCGKKRHLPSCLARPMHAHLSTFYFPPSAGAADPPARLPRSAQRSALVARPCDENNDFQLHQPPSAHHHYHAPLLNLPLVSNVNRD
jgi:hypothetical protein